MIALLEREMMYLSGPLAPFLIKKQIKNMGYDPDNFPADKMGELIEKVVENGVYDKGEHRELIKKLKKKITGS